METEDLKKIEKIINDRKKAHRYFNEKSRVYRSFVDMEQNAFKEGMLDKKYKEMIAIGISIRINCESCIEWHIKQALDSGASQEEIIEAIGIGIEMGGGPATVTARFAMYVLEFYSGMDRR
jgi:AhpD family alkylhydroperoxidase